MTSIKADLVVALKDEAAFSIAVRYGSKHVQLLDRLRYDNVTPDVRGLHNAIFSGGVGGRLQEADIPEAIREADELLALLPSCKGQAAPPKPPPTTEPPAVSQGVVIGQETINGDFAVTVASGDADAPSKLLIKVVTVPAQNVSVSWVVVCSKGFGAGSEDGSYAGSSPVTLTVKFPMADPDNCTLSASGQLNSSGKLTITLLAL